MTLPCGNPAFKVRYLPSVPFILTRALRSSRKAWLHFTMQLLSSLSSIFLINPFLQTVSKALRMSKSCTKFFFAGFCWYPTSMTCCSLAIWSVVDLFDLKPHWLGSSFWLVSSHQYMRFLTIRSVSFATQEVRDIDLWLPMFAAGLPGFFIGIVVALLHSCSLCTRSSPGAFPAWIFFRACISSLLTKGVHKPVPSANDRHGCLSLRRFSFCSARSLLSCGNLVTLAYSFMNSSAFSLSLVYFFPFTTKAAFCPGWNLPSNAFIVLVILRGSVLMFSSLAKAFHEAVRSSRRILVASRQARFHSLLSSGPRCAFFFAEFRSLTASATFWYHHGLGSWISPVGTAALSPCQWFLWTIQLPGGDWLASLPDRRSLRLLPWISTSRPSSKTLCFASFYALSSLRLLAWLRCDLILGPLRSPTARAWRDSCVWLWCPVNSCHLIHGGCGLVVRRSCSL